MVQSTEDLASKIFCILVPLTPTLTSASRPGQLIEWQTSTSWNTSEISSLLFCLGSQIGSYFGSVLTTIDIDKDSYTDLLLVGAPMYMGTEKEEQGKVYVYAVNQVRASEFGESRKIHSLQIPLIQLEYFSLAWGKNDLRSLQGPFNFTVSKGTFRIQVNYFQTLIMFFLKI